MLKLCAHRVKQCLRIRDWAKHAIDGMMPGQALLCLTSLCSVIPALRLNSGARKHGGFCQSQGQLQTGDCAGPSILTEGFVSDCHWR